MYIHVRLYVYMPYVYIYFLGADHDQLRKHCVAPVMRAAFWNLHTLVIEPSTTPSHTPPPPPTSNEAHIYIYIYTIPYTILYYIIYYTRVPNKLRITLNLGLIRCLFRPSRSLKDHRNLISYPEGPSTQYLRFLVPKTILLMVFGPRVLKYWVLGPSGLHSGS